MKIERTIGEKIKDLLDEKDIQAKELAEYIGVTQSAMSNYLNNKRDISAQTIAKIAEYLNVTTDFILLDTDLARIKLNNREEQLLKTFNSMSKEKQDAYLRLLELDVKK